MDSRTSSLTVVDDDGRAGAERLDLRAEELAIGANGMRALFDCWVSGSAPLLAPDVFAIPARIGGYRQVVQPTAGGAPTKVATTGGYPAIRFPSAASQFLLANYALPASYSFYYVFALSSASLTAAQGQQDPSDDGVLLQMNAGASDNLTLRHNASAGAAQVSAAHAFFHDGSISIVWGCFRHSDLQAAVGGMNVGNGKVRLGPMNEATFDRQHKFADKTRVSMASYTGGHDMLASFISPSALFYTDPDAHKTFLTKLAASVDLDTQA